MFHKISIRFLQAVLAVTGLAALAGMLWLPLTEGRAAHLDLVHIYLDPFILYGYAASALFFTALYKAFRLLGYIGRKNAFSSAAVRALKSIKKCALALGGGLAAAGLYIRIFHNRADDPAGFVVLSMAACAAALTAAALAAVAENIFQQAIERSADPKPPR